MGIIFFLEYKTFQYEKVTTLRLSLRVIKQTSTSIRQEFQSLDFMPARKSRPSPSQNKHRTERINGVMQKAVKRGERWRWVPVKDLPKRKSPVRKGSRNKDSFWNKNCKGKEDEDCGLHRGYRDRVPNYCANQCKDEIRKKAGIEYISTQNTNGSWYWKKLDDDDTYEPSTSNDRNVASPTKQVLRGNMKINLEKDKGSTTPSVLSVEDSKMKINFTNTESTTIVTNSYADMDKNPNVHIFAFAGEDEVNLYIIHQYPYKMYRFKLGDYTKMNVNTTFQKEIFEIDSANDTYTYNPATRTLSNSSEEKQVIDSLTINQLWNESKPVRNK